MPFTIGGEWIPESTPQPKLPIKIIKEKRRGSYVTLILNYSLNEAELKEVCSTLKQQFGCGGSVKELRIELQGDQIENVKAHLKSLKLK